MTPCTPSARPHTHASPWQGGPDAKPAECQKWEQDEIECRIPCPGTGDIEFECEADDNGAHPARAHAIHTLVCARARSTHAAATCMVDGRLSLFGSMLLCWLPAVGLIFHWNPTKLPSSPSCCRGGVRGGPPWRRQLHRL